MKPVRKPKEFPPVWANGVDDVWGMDLADMAQWHASNDGYKYILVIVDVFSRYAWAFPLKTKTATEVWDAFARVAGEGRPHAIWVDRGGEFYSKMWDGRLDRLDIGRYSTGGVYHVSIAERFIRTLKQRIWFEFVRDMTREWVSRLDRIVADYNKTEHSTIGMTPTEARTKAGEAILLKRIPKPVRGYPKYKLHTWVRISRLKGKFEKEFDPNWSYEIFKIVGIKLVKPVQYQIVDYYGEPVTDWFYESDLQPVGDPDYFPVEKVLQRRTYKGQKQALSKLVGYKNPVWLPAEDVADL